MLAIIVFTCPHATTIGTHDISSISVSSPHPGIVLVSGDIIDEAPSIGILVIIYSLTNDSKIYYNTFPYPLNELGANFVIEGLPADKYGVSVFVTEKSGLPHIINRAATTPKSVYVEGIR